MSATDRHTPVAGNASAVRTGSSGDVSARRMRALELHEAGVSDREIGECLGVAGSTVWKWRHPERRKEMDKRDRENRADARLQWNRDNAHVPCPICGGPMARATRGRCSVCRANAEHARKSCIQDMWHEGRTLAEIAAALDTTVDSLGVTMVRMRRQGWELPYRYTVRNGRRISGDPS